MAYYINKASVLGEILSVPRLKELSNGGVMLSFLVGTIRSWKNSSGEKMSASETHDIVIFGEFARTCDDILSKGDRVYVEGPIETVKWIDENDQERSKKQIRVREIVFLTEKYKQEDDNVF
jgi:single-strand DNA-binding protein